MPPALNLLSKTFGDLTVTKRVANNRYGQTVWSVLCSCGMAKTVIGMNLRNGSVVSCGSGLHKREAVIGRTFGMLTIIKSTGTMRSFGYSGNSQRVEAKCKCGGTWTGPIDSLKRGNTKSCGCLPTGSKPGEDREQPVLRRILRSYRLKARNRGLDWMLSDREFESLIRANCYYCGSGPSNIGRDKANAYMLYNNIGYTPNNSVSSCKRCNLAKREMSVDDFIALISKIYLYQQRAMKVNAA